MAIRWTVEEMQTIAAYGGGIDMDASWLSPADAQTIAARASAKGAQITFRNFRWTAQEAQTIGAYGKGCVTFVI